MFRKVFSYGGMLVLAGAAILATPDFGWAQHGGGHGGGGHFGGGHFGGAHFGGAHFAGARFGGYRSGFYHRGYYPFAYGYHPSSYGYYPYASDIYPDIGLAPAYNGGYYGAAGEQTPSYYDASPAVAAPGATFPADYPSAAAATAIAPTRPNNTADVTVSVPADAEVWFGGTKTTSTGSVREYESPPLTPASRYTYEIRARWNQNGQEVTQTQQVDVTAGAHVKVRFPVPPRNAGQGSAAQ
jgi:uncharacterized protein (TIGR03000 family)